MDTEVQRVTEWRKQKRREGYRQLTVWLKAEIKHQIEDLAAVRRQELGEVITEAVLALGEDRPAAWVDALTVHRLIDERLAALLPRLPAQASAPAEPDVAGTMAPVTLEGEYGDVIEAVRLTAAKLGRFTNSTMTRVLVGRAPKTISSALFRLVQRGELTRRGYVYFWVDPEKASTTAPAVATDSTLRRGEHGEVIQAIRIGAAKLGRFTRANLAAFIDRDPEAIGSTLIRLVKRGEMTKKGPVYTWAGTPTA
jgi:hypothetical protein